MKKISKRIICIALSFLCIFMSTYTVYASTDAEGDWEHLSNGHVIVDGVEYEPLDQNQVWHEVYYLFSKLGVVGKIAETGMNLGWAYEILSNSGRCVRGSDGTIYMRVDRKTEDGDNIKFNSDYVNDVYNGLKNIIQTEDGFSYVPTLKFNSLPYSYFSCDSAYDEFQRWAKQLSNGNYIGGMFQSIPIQQNFLFEIADFSTVKYLYFSQPLYTDEYFSSPHSYIYFSDGIRMTSVRSVSAWSSKNLSDLNGLSEGYASYYGISADKYYSSGYGRNICAYTWTSDGRTLKVYDSMEAVENAEKKHGVQNFYTSNTFNNYNVNNDNSITVNKKVYNDTDYVTINNNNYETINKTVNNYYEKNNSTIDTSSIEDIIKKFQEDQAKHDQEIIDKIDEGNKKTDEGNQISKDTNEKLDKIYAILQRIADKIGESGDSGTSGSDFDMNTLIEMLNNLQLSLDTMWQVDIKDIQKKLGTIVNDLKSDNPDSKSILEDIYKTQQQILELQQANYDQNKTFFDSVTDYLKKILHAVTLGDSLDIIDKLLDIKDDAESLGEFVDNIVDDLKPTVTLMKTKFPTSIPWDIIAVISVMSCEPQTPRFEIPVHLKILGQEYDDTIVIDLEQFERVALFGRALLTVMFTFWLLLITKQLLYKGE